MAEKTKVDVLNEIISLIEKYNESAEYSEFKVMKALDAEIADKVQEFNKMNETECFDVLATTENPMLEAARVLRYATIKVRDVKGDDGGTVRIVEDSTRMIDPLRLHKHITDGIGADKFWFYKIEKLNYLLTSRTAAELEAETVDEAVYNMNDKSRAIDCFKYSGSSKKKFNATTANKELLSDVQTVVDAMIGEGFEVPQKAINYLLKVYTRKDSRTSLSLTCSNHKALRGIMLEICHIALCGDGFKVNYKTEK